MKIETVLTCAWLVAASAGAGACGSSPGACPDAAPMGSGYTLVDDMEGTNGVISWTPPPGKTAGTWWTATDCTMANRIAPPPYVIDPQGWSYDVLPEPHETFAGVTSLHAARFHSISPLSNVWGAQVGVSFLSSILLNPAAAIPPSPGVMCRQGTSRDFTGETVDISAYSGLTFWGMADQAGLHTIHVHVRDRNSDPRYGFCNAANLNSDDGCNNDFTAPVLLTDTFTQHTIDFSTLRQDLTFGVRPDPSVVDLHHVYSLSFEVDYSHCNATGFEMCAGGSGATWTFDFLIDDLYLVSK